MTDDMGTDVERCVTVDGDDIRLARSAWDECCKILCTNAEIGLPWDGLSNATKSSFARVVRAIELRGHARGKAESEAERACLVAAIDMTEESLDVAETDLRRLVSERDTEIARLKAMLDEKRH